MTETVSALAGVLLSLAITYIKPFKAWFDGLSYWPKRVVLLVFIAIAAAVGVGLSCLQIQQFVDAGFTCDQFGVETAIKALLSAFISSQSTYQVFGKK